MGTDGTDDAPQMYAGAQCAEHTTFYMSHMHTYSVYMLSTYMNDDTDVSNGGEIAMKRRLIQRNRKAQKFTQ